MVFVQMSFYNELSGEIVLPNCDLIGGIETGQRIQRTLAGHGLTIETKKVNVTLSIGVCMLDERHKSLEQFINDTDQAMYQAKEKGRDRIEVISSNNLH